MQTTLHVQAAPGLKLPKEGDPYNYITDAAPVEVADCHYYRRAIIDGDLLALNAGQWTAYLAARAEDAASDPA